MPQLHKIRGHLSLLGPLGPLSPKAQAAEAAVGFLQKGISILLCESLFSPFSCPVTLCKEDVWFWGGFMD